MPLGGSAVVKTLAYSRLGGIRKPSHPADHETLSTHMRESFWPQNANTFMLKVVGFKDASTLGARMAEGRGGQRERISKEPTTFYFGGSSMRQSATK